MTVRKLSTPELTLAILEELRAIRALLESNLEPKGRDDADR